MVYNNEHNIVLLKRMLGFLPKAINMPFLVQCLYKFVVNSIETAGAY